MFEFQQLKQLITIAKYGTFSKAAEELHISQPALTRSIQKLEESLGMKLFERSKNKTTLNQNGELAIKCAHKVIDETNTMVETLKNFVKSQYTISVGSCAPAPLWELTPLLTDQYPDMIITSEMKDIEVLLNGLEENIYQIIITTKPIKQANICCNKFCEEQLCIAVPPAHPLGAFKEVSFEELNGESFLLLSEIGFWHNIHQEKMPDSLFLIQEQMSTFEELLKMSTLPNFISNLALKQYGKPNNRVIIPIIDDEAKATFYCSFKKANNLKFQTIFNMRQQ